MVMGERSTLTAGQKSLLGEESRDEGLEEKEWGDMGLASGEKPPCCSTGGRKERKAVLIYHKLIFPKGFPPFLSLCVSPDGMMTDKAVAEADLITLFPGLELRFSPSPDKCWWRALRRTRSLVARGPRGSYRGVITSRAAAAGPGDNVAMAVVTPGVSPCLGDLSVRMSSQEEMTVI